MKLKFSKEYVLRVNDGSGIPAYRPGRLLAAFRPKDIADSVLKRPNNSQNLTEYFDTRLAYI